MGSTSLSDIEVQVCEILLHVEVKVACVAIKMNSNCSEVWRWDGNTAQWVEEHEMRGQTETGFKSQLLSIAGEVRASYLISVLCPTFVYVTG